MTLIGDSGLGHHGLVAHANQECAERCIKALLMHELGPPPYSKDMTRLLHSHDLVELAGKLSDSEILDVARIKSLARQMEHWKTHSDLSVSTRFTPVREDKSAQFELRPDTFYRNNETLTKLATEIFDLTRKFLKSEIEKAIKDGNLPGATLEGDVVTVEGWKKFYLNCPEGLPTLRKTNPRVLGPLRQNKTDLQD